MIAQLPAIFSKITSRADRSYKLEFESRELSGQDANTLLGLLQHEGYLLFSPNPLQEEDVPDEKADSMTSKKTQAQRLRSVLFILWKQKGENGSFETYYQNQLELIIAQVKDKLE